MLMQVDNEVYFIVAAKVSKEEVEAGNYTGVIERFLDGKLSGKYEMLHPITHTGVYTQAFRRLAQFVAEQFQGDMKILNSAVGLVEIRRLKDYQDVQLRFVRLVRMSEQQLKELQRVAAQERDERAEGQDQEKPETLH